MFSCLSLCVYVCVCLRLFTMKASSVWIIWDTRRQINNVMLKTLISYAKSLHCYFRIQPLTFLTSHFILFAYWKRAKPRLNKCTSRFQTMGPSSTIKQTSPLVRATTESGLLWCQHSRIMSQSNQKKIRQLQNLVLNPVLCNVLKKIYLFGSNVVASLRRAPLVDALFEIS